MTHPICSPIGGHVLSAQQRRPAQRSRSAADGTGGGPRWLPRTGPHVRWPERARRAGLIAVLTTTGMLVFGLGLARLSPSTFLRWADLLASLPGTVVVVVLVSGVVYFVIDSVRLLLAGNFDPNGSHRRRLLLATYLTWLAATLAIAVSMLWYPSWQLFGSY